MPPSSATRWRPGVATPRYWRCAARTRRSGSSWRTTSWSPCSTWAITPNTSTRSSSGCLADVLPDRGPPARLMSMSGPEARGPGRLFLHLGHHLLRRLGHEAFALAPDGVLLGRLSGGGQVVHQGMDDVMIAWLLE